MGKIAKQGEWHIQAERLVATLLKIQDPAKVAVKADGHTDAVTGVSMTVADFFGLAKQALSGAM
ncbi:MAG: hypothetical protein HC888_16840 [Candidatus Competibacteraceae bacterium]|nr:hypothetical protein [Candidatus Competibacteraceae bacterium]